MQLVVGYLCEAEKTFELTPNRKRPMMSLGRHNYTAAASDFTDSKCLSDHILDSIALQVQSEMTCTCSEGYNSVLRKPSTRSIQEFNWDKICNDLQTAVSTLFKLPSSFLPKTDKIFMLW